MSTSSSPKCGCPNYPIVTSDNCPVHGHEVNESLRKHGDWERPQRQTRMAKHVELVRKLRASTMPDLGVAVRKGKFQAQKITFNAKGNSKTEPLTDWLPHDELIFWLESQVKDA